MPLRGKMVGKKKTLPTLHHKFSGIMNFLPTEARWWARKRLCPPYKIPENFSPEVREHVELLQGGLL
ncbi:MAG TPA: hypothetical protein ENI48_11490 [Thioploca sp.]|nr:hypothetical protein [Thioploca sp.]